MTYTLCYVSKAAVGLNNTAIEDIFLTTLQNNTRKGIHGILLYGMGDFFQVLEGDEKMIESLYEEQIKADPRHSDIFEVIRKETKKPIFSAYSSLFTIVKTDEQLEQIKAYLKQNSIHTTSEKLSRLLNPFLLDI
jgi:UDP-2,3-diacylglucosamine pyrophosphatase LpxH